MKQQKDTNYDNWLTYVAVLDNVYFEYPSPSPDYETMSEVKQDCEKYLDEFTTNYTMRDFYLKIKKRKSLSDNNSGPQKTQDPAQSTLPGADVI